MEPKTPDIFKVNTASMVPKTSAGSVATVGKDINAPVIVKNAADPTAFLNSVSLQQAKRIFAAFSLSDVTSEISELSLRRFIARRTSSSLENDLNASSLEYFRENFTRDLLQALRHESVEPGIVGQADAIVEKCLEKNNFVTASWLNELFLQNFDRPKVAADLLLLAGRLGYDVAKSSVVTMAIAGLTHKNEAVQEAAIRAFENWAAPELLNTLEHVEVKPSWLKKYMEQVKQDLKQIRDSTS